MIHRAPMTKKEMIEKVKIKLLIGPKIEHNNS